MTRKEIENSEEEKIRTMDDFVAYCSYWHHDFSYEWRDYDWDKSGYERTDYGKMRLHMWIPFEMMSILTTQVIGSSYFEDGNYPEVNMYCGGVYFGPDVIEDILEHLEMSEKDIELTFPVADIIYSYPDLTSEKAIDQYFRNLGKLEPENDDEDEEETSE